MGETVFPREKLAAVLTAQCSQGMIGEATTTGGNAYQFRMPTPGNRRESIAAQKILRDWLTSNKTSIGWATRVKASAPKAFMSDTVKNAR